MKRWCAAIVLGLAVTKAVSAQHNTLKIEVTFDKQEQGNAPLTIPLSVAKAWATLNEIRMEFTAGEQKGALVGQLTAPGITTEAIKPAKDGLVRRDLQVIMPSIGKARSCQLLVHFEKVDPQVTRFAWTEKKGEYQELSLTRSGTITPYLRYVNRPYDASSADARNKSYKVFHHLYDPTGKRFVTNGGFTDAGIDDPKKLVYPHHRGIMYGFNRCSYGPDLKLQADTWHCPPQNEKKKIANAAHIAHLKTLSIEAGPVLGRHRVLIGWYGDGNKPFAEEERELTVYNVPGGTLVEFASRLKTTGGRVRVDGDPQHAGFQFRAANDVAVKTKKQTYFLHPDGKAEMGKTRNWPDDKALVDLPWYALSFALDDQRYTVCYLNHPANPKDTRFSERDYGRIGGYFAQDITGDRPLVVNYRLWLQAGEMTPEQASTLRTAFASPPTAVVK